MLAVLEVVPLTSLSHMVLLVTENDREAVQFAKLLFKWKGSI